MPGMIRLLTRALPLALAMFIVAPPTSNAQIITPDWTQPTVVGEDPPERIAARRKASEAFVTEIIKSLRDFTPNVFPAGISRWENIRTVEDMAGKDLDRWDLNKLLLGAYVMHEQKKLTREHQQILTNVLKVRDKAYFSGAPTNYSGDNYQGANVLSIAYGRKILSARMTKSDRYLKTWFDGVLNNPNYLPDNNTVNSAAAVKNLIEIAILTDQFDKLKTKKMQMWFESFRDMVSPTGMPPTWGSGVSGERVYYWAFILEAAALLFDDPTYLYAADKVNIFHSKLSGHYVQKEYVHPHLLLDRTALAKMVPTPPETRSRLISLPEGFPRSTAKLDVGQPYKLVLRTGHSIEAGYAMMDLGFGYGTLTTQRQSIPFFASSGVNFNFYFQSSRHLPGHSASLVLHRKGMGFPMTPEQFAEKGFPELKSDGPDKKKMPELAEAWALFRTDDTRPAVADVVVEDRGPDAYARITFKNYGDERTTAVRHLLLTAEGMLVVRDDIAPSREWKDGVVGVTWPIDSKHGPKVQGDNWWTHSTEPKTGLHLDKAKHVANLMIYYPKAPGIQTSIDNHMVSAFIKPAPSVKMTFLTLLLPIGAKENATKVAASIKAISKHGGPAAIRIPKGGGNLTITMDPTGTWSVKRDAGMLVQSGEPTQKPDAETVKKIDAEFAELLRGHSDKLARVPVKIGAQTVKLNGITDANELQIEAGGRQGTVPWEKFPEADRARLAMTLARGMPDNVQANAIASFYLLKLNMVQPARALLVKAGPRQQEIRDAFGMK